MHERAPAPVVHVSGGHSAHSRKTFHPSTKRPGGHSMQVSGETSDTAKDPPGHIATTAGQSSSTSTAARRVIPLAEPTIVGRVD